jgi:hypothetical protein
MWAIYKEVMGYYANGVSAAMITIAENSYLYRKVSQRCWQTTTGAT